MCSAKASRLRTTSTLARVSLPLPMGGPAALDDILCEVHERTVGRDNCVRFDRLTLQIEPGGARPHYVKAKVTVRRHMDGSLSVWHGPQLLRRYEAGGTRIGEPDSLFVLKPDISVC